VLPATGSDRTSTGCFDSQRCSRSSCRSGRHCTGRRNRCPFHAGCVRHPCRDASTKLAALALAIRFQSALLAIRAGQARPATIDVRLAAAFQIPSWQVGTAHAPERQRTVWSRRPPRSPGRARFAEQLPPQSTSVSLPSRMPSRQAMAQMRRYRRHTHYSDNPAHEARLSGRASAARCAAAIDVGFVRVFDSVAAGAGAWPDHDFLNTSVTPLLGTGDLIRVHQNCRQHVAVLLPVVQDARS